MALASSPRPSTQPESARHRESVRPLPIEQPQAALESQAGAAGSKPPPNSLLEELKSGAPTPKQIENWQDAVKTWSRLALLFPLITLVITLLSPDSIESDLGGVKWKVVTGAREIAAVATALLLAKLVRDLGRLVAFAGTQGFSLDVATAATLESYLRQDYVRPVDLFEQRIGGQRGLRVKLLRMLEALRSITLCLLCVGVASASLTALLFCVFDMVVAPRLTPHLSLALAITSALLLIIAGFDLFSIVVSKLPNAKGARRTPEWDELVAWCDEHARSLRKPISFPTPWPPLGWEALHSFQELIQTCETAEWCKHEHDLDPLKVLRYSIYQFPDQWPPATVYDFDLLRFYFERDLERRKKASEPSHSDVAKRLYEDTTAWLNEVSGPFLQKPSLCEPEYYRDYDNQIGSYRDIKFTSDKDLDMYRTEVQKTKEEVEKLLSIHQTIEWCRHENAFLKNPLVLPEFWNAKSDTQAVNVAAQIMFRRWLQDRSVWNYDKSHWTVPARMTVPWMTIKISGLFQALQLAVAHPHPFQALRSIIELTREREWLLALQACGQNARTLRSL